MLSYSRRPKGMALSGFSSPCVYLRDLCKIPLSLSLEDGGGFALMSPEGLGMGVCKLQDGI